MQFTYVLAALAQIGLWLLVSQSSRQFELSSPAASPLARSTPSQAFAH
jgi:hypothetical protein